MKWALHVRIYERSVGPDYPVVEHIFYGRTKREAEGYRAAHLTTDSFFRCCVQRQRFERIDCWAESFWEQVP